VSGEGWEALGSFLYYLPRTVRAVLVSRRDIPSAVHRQLAPTSVASLREEDLALTVEEAAEALRLNDNATIDPAVSATGGCVTEFGRHALIVDGVEGRLRISKSLELLSYLSSRPGHAADRLGSWRHCSPATTGPPAPACVRRSTS
jgi:hypothetical protein